MANGWRSTRLLYRAVEDDDKTFLQEMSQDWSAWTGAAPMLPAPQGHEAAKGSIEWFRKEMMAAIVCLPAPATTDTATAMASKPVPIGYITLSALPPHMVRHRHTGIGLQIIKAYQGKGYGSEAIRYV
jgi:RimJ/RimL family protein N-acetyltransferase